MGVRGSFEPPSENPSCGAQVESSPKRNELKEKPTRKENATEQIKSLILVLRNRMDVYSLEEFACLDSGTYLSLDRQECWATQWIDSTAMSVGECPNGSK